MKSRGLLPGRSGQGLLEYLLVVVLVIAGLAVVAGPVRQNVGEIFARSSQGMSGVGTAVAELPAWMREREQGESEAAEDAPADEDFDLAAGPGFGGSSGGAGGGGGGSGGGGGGGGGRGGGGGGGGLSIPTTPPSDVPSSGHDVTPPVAGVTITPEEAAAKINGAAQLIFGANPTFALFDFSRGETVVRHAAEILDVLIEQRIPLYVSDLVVALAAVVFDVYDDGTVKLPPAGEVLMTFDLAWLATATTEAVAAVLAHEGWHVVQLFSGIHDDFTHYPRVVDIEYESFVVEAAVWAAVKGSQSDPNIDAGAACVALGEARCKEVLASDFGYATGPRQPSSG